MILIRKRRRRRTCHSYKSKFSNPLVGAYFEVPSQYRSFEVYMAIFCKDISLDSKEKNLWKTKQSLFSIRKKIKPICVDHSMVPHNVIAKNNLN